MSTGPSLLSLLASDSLASTVGGGEPLAGIAATVVEATFLEPLSPAGPSASGASVVFIDQCVRMDDFTALADNDNFGGANTQYLQAYQVARYSGGEQDATK